MLLALLDKSFDIALQAQAFFVGLIDFLEDLVVDLCFVIDSGSRTTVLNLPLFSLDHEFSVRIALAIASDDVLRF